jgi:DNA-binding transcriptional MerR regulator
MQNTKPIIKQVQYTIGEVAKMFKDAPVSTIRYWSDEFDEIKPTRNKKGNRIFSSQDIETFKIIYNLLKVQGMTLEGAKRKLERLTKEEENMEIVNRLENIKSKLLEIQQIYRYDQN